MKMRIIDLMDSYSGNGIKLDPPERVTKSRSVYTSCGPISKEKHHGRQALLISAAVFLLVVTATFTVSLTAFRITGRQATAEVGTPEKSVIDTVPSELPATIPEDNMNLEGKITQTETSAQIIHGTETETSYYCYGNILCVDGAYYTMTGNGPMPLETKNLHTTVELYGSWEVDLDYAVVDGELVLHNNTSTARYTIVDGKRLKKRRTLRSTASGLKRYMSPV